MSNILIYDVAAESGGALTVLKEFYLKAQKDRQNKYFFVISIPELKNSENIVVYRFPWVKKTWFHRIYMDHYYVYHIIKNNCIEQIISLQNHTLKGREYKQTVYVHNAIPYCSCKFSIFNQPYLWFYQNIIGHYTISSLKCANEIIVQTEWMKRVVSQVAKVNQGIIRVEPIKVNLPDDVVTERKMERRFFYPATPYVYKNHQVIIDACKLLKKQTFEDYEVIFTIVGDENKCARKIKKQISRNNLQISLVGQVTQKKMSAYYQTSCLLFPSFVETVGLPLKEAQAFSTPIIAADCEYVHEAVEGYQNVQYFKHFDAEALASLMWKYLQL